MGVMRYAPPPQFHTLKTQNHEGRAFKASEEGTHSRKQIAGIGK